MIKVMVVDDHYLVRTGIRRMLDDQPGISVIAEAESGEEALAIMRTCEPDLVLMDVRMPGIGGLEATHKITRKYDGVRVIAVTVCEEEPFPSRLLKAGASGYLTKGADIEEMVRAIKTVYLGQRYISPNVAQQMALRSCDGYEANPFDVLSSRELQVMTMIINGKKVHEISDRLSLSPKTINTYRYRIFDKLSISSDVEMTLLAIRHGLLDADLVS